MALVVGRHSVFPYVAALAITVPLTASAQQPPAQQAPPTAQVGQVSGAQPRAPLPNRLNEVLPGWLRVRGEFRERLEGFGGAGFDDSRDDLYTLSRLRFNATVTPSRQLSFQVQVQDARVAKKTVGPTGAPFSGPIDLRMAFADIGSSSARVAVRAGRQELIYGEQRLVGPLGWLNTPRTFDAVRVSVRSKPFSVDLFGGSLVRTLVDEFDKSGVGNRFAGIYGTTTAWVPRATVEPYLLWKRDVNVRGELGSFASLEHASFGVRLAGKLPAQVDYGVEMAVQRGSLGSEDVRAWAGHWELRKSLTGPGAVSLTGEYNYASGDEDPADGIRGTFDHLYPSPHDRYGLADQIGWKNVHHVRAGFTVTPLPGLPVTTNYHSWWLAENRDGIYGAAGAPLARLIQGAAERHIGQELDVQIARALTPQLQLAAGYAHIFAGGFVKEATPGASYKYPFVMLTYVFLADR